MSEKRARKRDSVPLPGDAATAFGEQTEQSEKSRCTNRALVAAYEAIQIIARSEINNNRETETRPRSTRAD